MNHWREDRDIFEEFEAYDLLGMVGYVLKCSEFKAWKYERAITEMTNIQRDRLRAYLSKHKASVGLYLYPGNF